MTKLVIRENYEAPAQFWVKFWEYCRQQSDDFRGITDDYYVGTKIAELGGTWHLTGGYDYRQNMWVEFCDDKKAMWFIMKFS